MAKKGGNSMEFPQQFALASDDAIQTAIESENWVLVAAIDDSEASEYLAEYLGDEMVEGVLENFTCFYIPFDSELATRLAIEHPASLSVFVNGEEPEYTFILEYPEEQFPEDIVRFLDDTASHILYGDDVSDDDDDDDD